MNLILFADMQFGDEDALRDFLMRNSLAHQAVAAKFMSQGMSVPAYPIDDISDFQDWLSTHAAIHQQEFANLGVSTKLSLLDEVDWKDEEQFRNWHFMHALLHQQVDQVLGIV
jgi:hypothetical protein